MARRSRPSSRRPPRSARPSRSVATRTISPTPRGRLPYYRPHMFRVMASVDVPHTKVVFAANLQHLSGKSWAATERLLHVPQYTQLRVLSRTARIASPSVADPARRPHLESVPTRRPESHLSARRCAHRPQRRGRGEHADGCEIHLALRLVGVRSGVARQHLHRESAPRDAQRQAEPCAEPLLSGHRPARYFFGLHQDDVGVLPDAIEHDGLAVRRDVERSHGSLVRAV